MASELGYMFSRGWVAILPLTLFSLVGYCVYRYIHMTEVDKGEHTWAMMNACYSFQLNMLSDITDEIRTPFKNVK